MSGHLRIRRATRADCRMYWEWANEEAVRAASFSSEPIPWETHVAWFEKRVEAPDCRLYLACDPAGRPVGQVRYELEGDEAIVSISIPAEHRGKGAVIKKVEAQ